MKRYHYLTKMLIMLLVFFFSLLIGNQVKAGSIKLNKLDFEIQLNEDGSMDVVENWNAKITDTNTMFKDFYLDSSKFKKITNVEVYRVSSGNKQKLTQIDKEMYHVTKNCYYGLPISGNKFEIAWGVSVNGTETRNYQVKYKVVDVIKTYADCSELYWQLVGTDNAIPVTKLTGTIKLPKAVAEKNNIRGWAHGPYNGNITVSEDKVYLDVDYLDTGVMVEARIAVLEDLFSKNKRVDKSKFSEILAEEQSWADQANREREKYIKDIERSKRIEKIIAVAYIIATIALTIFLIYNLIKNGIKARQTEKRKMPKLDYFRDIPNKEASAGDAAYLYYHRNGSFRKNISKILSATLLQLSLKKYIAFSEDKTKAKPQVRINILNNTEQLETLTKDEVTVLSMLKDVTRKTNKVGEIATFTMKEFEKYAKDKCEIFMKKIEAIEVEVKSHQIVLKNYSNENEKKVNQSTTKAILYVTFGITGVIVTIPLFPWLTIPAILLILNSIPHFSMAKKVNELTDKGLEEKAKWVGLKKYMEDFSLLNEREVPDLKLWEKYLVFATAFGIADKVLKQLKIKYPELQNSDVDNYSYIHMLYHSSLNNSFINTLNTSVNRVYMGGMSAEAARSGYDGSNFSSGGGFGGGFSGGGGGRRWRRPEWAEDKKSSHFHVATFENKRGCFTNL